MARSYAEAHLLEPSVAYYADNARQLTAIARLWDEAFPPIAVGGGTSDGVPPATFWERNGVGDGTLTRLVEFATCGDRGGTGAPTVGLLVEQYLAAFLLRSSAANRRSVTERLDDIADLLPDDVALRHELRGAFVIL